MMIKAHKRIASIVTGGAMLLLNALPVLAADVTVSGNGSDSENNVAVSHETTSTVVQSNDTYLKNQIRIKSSTGDNEANDNTGGEVGIRTGDADVSVLISNMANMNDARVDNCGSCGMDAVVEVIGNGSDSESNVALNHGQTTSVFQENEAYVKNDLDFDVETGDNDAEDNTGGDIAIVTGDADVFAAVENRLNYNRFRMGGAGTGASAEVVVQGNGSDSEQNVGINSSRYDLLTQANDSYIRNDFNFDVDTGDNDAEDNTGGEVGIATGDADVAAFVSTYAGFNSAWLDCCILMDEEVKINGNGSDSESNVSLYSSLVRSLFQENDGRGIFNDMDLDLETGDNEASDNTEDGDDPFIWTGDSDVFVDVANAGGMNHYGASAPSWDWPEVEFSFNLGQFMAWLR